MKRILVFGITDIKGGVESVIMNYYRNINKEKIQFDFLCNNEQVAYEDEIKELGGNIYRVTARSKSVNKYKSDMTEFFEKNAKNYDTIWVNLCSLANIDYLKYAKKYGIRRRIIHSHNSQNMDSFLRGILHRINRLFVSQYATDFWSCSNEASKWFYSDKIINSNCYRIINNAINTEKFEFNEQIRNDYRTKFDLNNKLVIGNVGRFHFQKNHPFIIKVFNEIHKKRPDSELLLIGAGADEDNIRQIVKDYNLEDSVRFLVSRNDVPELMQAIDVFLFPSLFEGLPVTLVEAQTAGLMIYASKDKITNEVVIDKNSIKFISLDDGEKVWCDTILKDAENGLFDNFERRKSKADIVKKAGFDIKTEALKLEEIFSN